MGMKQTKVTNSGGAAFHTVVGGTRSDPKVETVRVGETKTIPLDVEAPHVKAALAAGLLTLGGEDEVAKEGRRQGAIPAADGNDKAKG